MINVQSNFAFLVCRTFLRPFQAHANRVRRITELTTFISEGILLNTIGNWILFGRNVCQSDDAGRRKLLENLQARAGSPWELFALLCAPRRRAILPKWIRFRPRSGGACARVSRARRPRCSDVSNYRALSNDNAIYELTSCQERVSQVSRKRGRQLEPFSRGERAACIACVRARGAAESAWLKPEWTGKLRFERRSTFIYLLLTTSLFIVSRYKESREPSACYAF